MWSVRVVLVAPLAGKHSMKRQGQLSLRLRPTFAFALNLPKIDLHFVPRESAVDSAEDLQLGLTCASWATIHCRSAKRKIDSGSPAQQPDLAKSCRMKDEVVLRGAVAAEKL